MKNPEGIVQFLAAAFPQTEVLEKPQIIQKNHKNFAKTGEVGTILALSLALSLSLSLSLIINERIVVPPYSYFFSQRAAGMSRYGAFQGLHGWNYHEPNEPARTGVLKLFRWFVWFVVGNKKQIFGFNQETLFSVNYNGAVIQPY
jgi:hypothetical protein